MFVVSKKLSGLDKMFKAWAGMGIPCCFLVSGKNNRETVKKDENAQRFMENLIRNNMLSVEESIIKDDLDDMVYKVYALKR